MKHRPKIGNHDHMTLPETIAVSTYPAGALHIYRRDEAYSAENLRKTISIGLNPTPTEYTRWFQAIDPGHAAFTRVYSPPDHGLPSIDGYAIAYLPDGTYPAVSHKDRVPIDKIHAYWLALREKYQPPAGRPIYWIPQHEHAPASDRTEYLAYLRDVVDAARQHAPWIEVVQVQSNYAMRWRADTNWRDWLLPGVSLSFDTFPTAFGVGQPYEPVESAFGLLLAAAKEIGAPRFGAMEFGAEVRDQNPLARANYIRNGVAYLDEIGADFVGLWCSKETRGYQHYDYRPIDAATLRAYQELLTP